jgi:Transposase zinc-ribbon domain
VQGEEKGCRNSGLGSPFSEPSRLTHTPPLGLVDSEERALEPLAGDPGRADALCRGWEEITAATAIAMDVDQHAALPFPRSLPEFQRLFPNDAACAEYLEKVRRERGFVCPRCEASGEPFHISTRPGVLTCLKCRSQTGLTVGTVMERSRAPLCVWFWPAYLVASQTPAISAVQLPTSRVTRPPFRSSTSSALQCFAPIGIASAVARTSMSRSTKLGSAATRAAKAGAFTTRPSSLAPSRCGVARPEPRKICERTDATPDAFGSPSPPTEGRLYPFNAFRSLLGIAGNTTAPTYAELYSGHWAHPKSSGRMC